MSRHDFAVNWLKLRAFRHKSMSALRLLILNSLTDTLFPDFGINGNFSDPIR